MITESPALLAREQQIFAGYTASLAALLAEETGRRRRRRQALGRGQRDDGRAPRARAPRRRRVVEGARHPKLAAEVRARAEEALALLDGGLEDYAVKG